MSMYTLLRNNPTPSEEGIEAAFEGEKALKYIHRLITHTSPLYAGNLCRCTGYRPILEGYKTFAKVYYTDVIHNVLTVGN